MTRTMNKCGGADLAARPTRQRTVKRALGATAAAILFAATMAPDGLGGGFGGGPGMARAQSVISQGESFVDVALLPGPLQADGSRMAALVVDVAPGWKTYWRHPGSAGIPPRFDWSASGNLTSAEVQWPRPNTFESFGLDTLGYGGRVVFPIHLVPGNPDAALEVQLGLTLGVCKDICVLEETAIEASFAPDTPPDGAELVATAQALVPQAGTELGLSSATCRIIGAGKKRSFQATLDFAEAPQGANVILEGSETAWFSEVETGTDPATGEIAVTANLSLIDDAAWIDRSSIRMTVLADGFAADIQGCAAPAG